jgi:C_GCAxxG_C_C family probable redox protein
VQQGETPMIDEVSKRSGDLFESGFYCAESVLLAIADNKGVHSDLLPKIATGFCGGVSRTCGMCGAVSGGIMAISLFSGRTSANESILPTYEAVRQLLQRFAERFGSTNCQDLTGCDLGTDEGQNYFKTNNIRDKCRQLTEEATAIAATLIEEHLSKPTQ